MDQYWSKIRIDARAAGEEYRDSYYRNANEAIKHFRLYSLEFGNWLNQEMRQVDLDLEKLGYKFGTGEERGETPKVQF